MFGKVRGALGQQHREATRVVHQRHQHGGRYGLSRKMFLQPLAAFAVDAQQPPVGQFVLRLAAFEPPQYPAAPILTRVSQPEPPPPSRPPCVSNAGSSSFFNSGSDRPDISSATSKTGRPSA